MLSYKNYYKKLNEDILTEAKISAANVERAISLIQKIVEKRLGKLYRYGGSGGIVEYGRGFGFLFFTKTGKGIRFNYENGELNSISLWRKYKMGKLADYTIEIGGLNMVQTMGVLLDVIEKPRAGKIAWANIFEAEETLSIFMDMPFLTEARRTNPEEFYEMVMKALSPSEKPEKLSIERVAEIALQNDVQVPGFVRHNKVGKGYVSAVPDSKTTGNEQECPTYYIKVTAQDPKTKKFLSTKQDKGAQELTRQIQSQLNNPTRETIDKEIKDPESLFGIMTSLVQLVTRGSRNSLVIYGGPGIGKTYTVLETIKKEGLKKNKDWYHIKGKVTNAALYQTLFMHRQKGKVLLFDDADSVWGDNEAANILKAALDSYEARTISWSSSRTQNVSMFSDDEREEFNRKKDDELSDPSNEKLVKLPNEFEFKGKIIFISNLPKNKFDSAVLSRSAKIDMTLTQEQIFARIEAIIEHIGPSDIPNETKLEVLEFLKSRSNEVVDQTSIRTFVAALDVYRSGLPNWKELIDYV
tara:strand:+ start:1065 stop:2642 length:1578 start_codon:yes stop_codon:yes gene_type:complete